MNWLKKDVVLKEVKSKISKPKPTTTPPTGQKWVWSNDDQEWILMTEASADNYFKVGDKVCLSNENEITGKIVNIQGDFVNIDLGTIPRKISKYHYTNLVLANDTAELPKKSVEEKQVSFAEYMRKREAARKILAILLDKIKFTGTGTKKEIPITTDKESEVEPAFGINASVRKKGTILTGKIIDIKADNSITIKWKDGKESTNWLIELEKV
jgi:hypothetical protein